jgi:hypothetical protein
MKQGETITIAWCDSGMVEGQFAESLMKVVVNGILDGLPISSFIRNSGIQIARQRQMLLDDWYDNHKSDWLFWVDSDIVLTLDIIEKICLTANKDTHPIVSGVYFVSKELDGSLPMVLPVIYDEIGKDNRVRSHHPLPIEEIIKIDGSGMGLVIIHRDVVTKLRKKYGNEISFFAENHLKGNDFVGEDVSFFRKCNALKIPIYAHTGAIAQHVKKSPWDLDYYNLYWNKKNNE